MTLVWRPGYLEGDRYFSNVSLLLHGDGPNGSTTITDSSPTPKTVTAVGNAQISTAQSKFGGASIAFDGNGDYLDASSSNQYAIGTEDFTVEGWVYVNEQNPSNSPRGLFQQSTTLFESSLIGNIALSHRLNGKWHMYAKNTFYESSQVVTAQEWIHFALVRHTGSTTLYSNGSPVINVASDNTNYAGTVFGIGSIFSASSSFNLNGYIDDFRVTKGIARYTSNFTPPTAPFPDAQY